MMKLTKFQPFWKRTFTINESCYLFFAALRFILVFIEVNGYVHPDEFFQSVEVMTGDHFRLEHTRTWEFDSTKPVRSITLQFLLLRIPWSFLEFLALYVREYFGIELLCSYTYMVFPRLIYCVISFINDYSIYQLCRLYGLRHDIRLLALGSSWIMLVLGIRTFSNSIEMALCSMLLYLVAECMIKTNTIVYKQEYLEKKYKKADSIGERVKIWKLKNALPSHNYSRMFIVSTLCIVGIFNRPTFILFGGPMIFFYMLRGMGTKTITFRDFNIRMLLFCTSAIPSLLFFIFCDSLYYKHLTLGEIQMLNIQIDNFIFTPWNFIKYNLDASNTAEHGIHPRYVHMLINIPLLYNVLGVIMLVSFGRILWRFVRAEYVDLPRTQSLVGLVSAAIFVPLLFLSLINHQEARFLMPLTIPTLLLHAPKLQTGFCATYPFKKNQLPFLQTLYANILCTKASANAILKTWCIVNLILTIFFGFIHQAGVFPLAQHFESAMKSKEPNEHFHLITSHIYSMPLTFVNVPIITPTKHQHKYRRHKEFTLYEYGGLNITKLFKKMELIISKCEMKYATRDEKYRLFLAMPTSLRHSLYQIIAQTPKSVDFDLIKRTNFYPHLSVEAGLNFQSLAIDFHHDHFNANKLSFWSWSYATNWLARFGQQFELTLYEIKPKVHYYDSSKSY